MFQKGIDTKDFGEKLLERAMYSSCVSADDDVVTQASPRPTKKPALR